MADIWVLNLKHTLQQLALQAGKRIRIVEENADGSNPVEKQIIAIPAVPGLIDATLYVGVTGQVQVNPAGLTTIQKAAIVDSALIDRLDKVTQA